MRTKWENYLHCQYIKLICFCILELFDFLNCTFTALLKLFKQVFHFPKSL